MRRLYICPLVSAPDGFVEAKYMSQSRGGRCYPRGSEALTLLVGDAAFHQVVAADATVTSLPVHPPSTLMRDIPAAERNALQGVMTARGIDVADVIGSDSYRKPLIRLARWFQAGVGEEELEDSVA